MIDTAYYLKKAAEKGIIIEKDKVSLLDEGEIIPPKDKELLWSRIPGHDAVVCDPPHLCVRGDGFRLIFDPSTQALIPDNFSDNQEKKNF